MTTQEIADRLVAMNRENKSDEIYQELYAPDVVSIENWGDRQEFVGFEAIAEKGKMWASMLDEMHDMKVSEPLVADKSFAVTFYMDATFNENGGPEMTGRMQFTELAVYHVNDEGKIYKEEFTG